MIPPSFVAAMKEPLRIIKDFVAKFLRSRREGRRAGPARGGVPAMQRTIYDAEKQARPARYERRACARKSRGVLPV